MSARPYENYLVDVFVEWATDKVLPGFRYQFQSPDHNNAIKLHSAFLEAALDAIVYGDVKLPVMKVGGTNVIPVLHGDEGQGFSENYISHLRDCVASRT